MNKKYENIKLTIVTVVYNAEKTIARCMKSVLPELNDSIEYLIIDGDSIDNTKKIIKNISSGIKNIRLYSEKDDGIYDAMNKGINRANGKWIYFLNADDELKNDVLYKVIDEIDKNDVDCIYGNVNNVLEHNGKLYLKVENAINNFDYLKKSMIFSHQSFFCKTEIIRKLGGFNTEFKIAADWDLIIRLWQLKYKFKYIDAIFANFYLGGASSQDYKYEKHLIRKKNNLVGNFDKYYLADIFCYARNRIYRTLFYKLAVRRQLGKFTFYKNIDGNGEII